MKQVTEKAPAKINLWLDVENTVINGFHPIVTVMQTVGLCDTVTVTKETGEGIELTVSGNEDVPTDSKNLAWRGAEAFLQKVGVRAKITIHIDKQIPMAGGLAGGSADCAAVLRGLNRLWDHVFTQEELCEIGLALGSDVPFCIVGGTALCRGRGEIMTPIRVPFTYGILIANSGEAIQTPMAYALIDAHPEHREDKDVTPCLNALETGDFPLLSKSLYNRFEKEVLPMAPGAYSQKEEILKCGAATALMSGSGATVYGLFPTKEAAEAARKSLPFISFAVENL